jgi:hypothetical protein
LDENIITSINRWKPGKAPNFGWKHHHIKPLESQKVTKLLAVDGDGRKGLVYNELCIFVSLFSCRLKATMLLLWFLVSLTSANWLVFSCA